MKPLISRRQFMTGLAATAVSSVWPAAYGVGGIRIRDHVHDLCGTRRRSRPHVRGGHCPAGRMGKLCEARQNVVLKPERRLGLVA